MKFSACGVEDFPHPLVYDKENLCLIIVVEGEDNKMWHYDIPRKLTWWQLIDQVFKGEKPNNIHYVDNEKDVIRLGSEYEWREFLRISKSRISGRLTASSDSCKNLDKRCCLPYLSDSDTEPSSFGDMLIDGEKLVVNGSERLDLDAKICKNKKMSVTKTATSLTEEDGANAAQCYCERSASKKSHFVEMNMARAQMLDEKRKATVVKRKQLKKKPDETSSSSEPPLWFTTYMKKFVKDINDKIDRTVARRMEKGCGNSDCAHSKMKQDKPEIPKDKPVVSHWTYIKPETNKAKHIFNQPYRRNGQVKVLHEGIECQICMSEIEGIRYKCGHCLDFDLCAACEKAEVHDQDHIFIKIRRPIPDFQEDKTRTPLLTPCIYGNKDLPPFIRKQREPETGIETNIKMDFDAKFLFDENVPDGTEFLPGEQFTKRWRMVNFGSQQWDSDTKLKFLWGSKELRPPFVEIDVPHLKPRQNGLLSVQYTAPSTPGFYENHFTLTHKGQPFGHRIWCSIEVIYPNGSDNEECFKSLSGALSLEPENGECQNPNKGLSSEEMTDLINWIKGHQFSLDDGTLSRDAVDAYNGDSRLTSPEKLACIQNQLSEDAVNASNGDNQLKSSEISTCIQFDDDVVPDLVSVDDVYPHLQGAEGSVVQDSENASVVNVSSSSSESEFIVVPMPDCFNLMKPCIVSAEDKNLPSCSGSLGEQKLLECTGVKEKSLSASSSIIFLSPEEDEIGAKDLKFDLGKKNDYSCKDESKTAKYPKTKEQREPDEVKLKIGITSIEIELPSPDCAENNPLSTPGGNMKRDSLASIFDSALQWVTIPPDDNGDFIDPI